jgi:hypothetical protein
VSFGSGRGRFPTSATGDLVALIVPLNFLQVPVGYISGNPLSDGATYDHATIASMGPEGTYEWTWGTGLPNQNFTLVIEEGTPRVPDGASTISLLSFALLGLAAFRRKLA